MKNSFLSKKSFHPKSIRNLTRVWEAEQRAAREQARIMERQREIQEERRREEVQRMRNASQQKRPSSAKTFDTSDFHLPTRFVKSAAM